MNKKNPNYILLIQSLIVFVVLLNIFSTLNHNKATATLQMSHLMFDASKEFEQWAMASITEMNWIAKTVGKIPENQLKREVTRNTSLEDFHLSSSHSDLFIGFIDGKFVSNGTWSPPDLYDPTERTWYQLAAKFQTTLFSEPYVDKITNDYVITLAAPLFTAKGFIGVVGSDFYLKDLNAKLMSLHSIERSNPFLMNQNNIILADAEHPQNINKDAQMEKPIYLNFMTKAKQNKSPVHEIINNTLYVYYYDENLQWLIGSSLDITLVPSQFKPVEVIPILFNLLLGSLLLAFLARIKRMDKKIEETLLVLNESQAHLTTQNQQLKETTKALAYRADHDGLTGLHNRYAFDEHLNLLINQGFQHRKYIGLILFDIDDFKSYNDIYGHVQGDMALKTISSAIVACSTEALIVARYGGEEFALLYYDHDIDELNVFAIELQKCILELNLSHKLSNLGCITVSGGVNAIIPTLTTSRGKFIHQADTALYQAKSNGKNQFVNAYQRE